MFSAPPPGGPGPREGAGPGPSELVCEVCGRHALKEDTPHEFAAGLIDQLVCTACGAHRLLEPP